MTLQTLKAFNLNDASVTVWVFKKHVDPKTKLPVFTGRWINTSPDLDAGLRTAIAETRAEINETIVYDLLAQNNESSALSIELDETHAPLIVEQTADPLPKRMVKKLKDLNNAAFYVVKVISNGQALYGIRKTDSSWRSKVAKNTFSVIYEGNQLTIDESPRFSISRHFDFFIVDETILVLEKGPFESLLSYKEAHIDDFSDLQKEEEFLEVFTDLAHIVAYVGNNKIQLRRASAIRQKAHYKNSDFMDRLKAQYKALGFNLTFDAAGRIVPTPETCRDIFQALLDHRLDSRLSMKIYDVENTTPVVPPR